MSLTAIAFLAAYFGGLLRAFTTNPTWGLYVYLIAFYANPVDRWWGYSLPNLRWSFLAAIVTFIAVIFKRKGQNWLQYKETKYYLIFFIYLVFQYLWVLSSSLHTVYVLLVAKYFILILLIQQCIHTKKDILGFIACNALGALYFGYLGMSYGGGRLEGIGGPGIESANGLGQHLATLLVAASYMLFLKLGKFKILLVAIILVILNTLMLTESRGSLLALVVTGCVAVFFIPKNYKRTFYTLMGLGAIAFAMLLGPQIVDRFKSAQKNELGQIQDNSAASRIVIIKAQYEMFKEHPILGKGHRTTLVLSPLYVPEEYMTKIKSGDTVVQRRASHNYIMGMLTDHGLLGMGIYSLIIFSIFRHLLAVRKYIKSENYAHLDSELIMIQTGLCLAFCCYMVAGMFSNNKIFEIAVWLIALIPIVGNLLEQSYRGEKNAD